ncbi:Multidrug transporter MdtA [Thalassovita gelatinovora]|uniref:Multidrug transporter MdtA n=1 Tax=Thalassovita gelatinovora TaxID=53501 RepID=A0A0P1FHA1_THAGE|nr:efflux RND transporter periplasmic adaptor subunit [Thalassovita gelatinovora]QIZ81929.1 efflux RND transporter periplasmic adaptor subunit [Thalassovita gelatinovora]CUH67304.1 Multidrug transporter MdtA [Thalassovita gelatinovora]SEP76581.1 RND family efflux transporter, MFP subunit [Thalassovita gelatinovora]
MKFTFVSMLLLFLGSALSAETLEVKLEPVTEWKPVYGEIEARNLLPARTRISGTLVTLAVTEGDRVETGQVIATIEDDKLGVQIDAMSANLDSLKAQQANAEAELTRGKQLLERGTITEQRLDALQTAVDVLVGQITATEAQRQVIRRQVEEGDVLAPEAGIVLAVPVSQGSVLGMGEAVAQIGSGGVFLRLSIPERFAGAFQEGDEIAIEGGAGQGTGTIAKLYPQIQGGRVQADVEVTDLDDRYLGLRLPVRLPVGERQVILVPEHALSRSGGLDFVTVDTPEGQVGRVVIPGIGITRDGTVWREVLTGLEAGDRVVISNE